MVMDREQAAWPHSSTTSRTTWRRSTGSGSKPASGSETRAMVSRSSMTVSSRRAPRCADSRERQPCSESSSSSSSSRLPTTELRGLRQLVGHRVDQLDPIAVEVAQPVDQRPLGVELAGVGDRPAQVAADVEGGVVLQLRPGRDVGEPGQDEEAQALGPGPERDEEHRPDPDAPHEVEQQVGLLGG